MTVTATGKVSDELLATLNPTKKKTDAATDSQSRFLTMLTSQLKNQDPMNPLDNSQMTSQLAQISTVDGINKLNTTLETMMGSFRANETMQAAAMVGRGVLVAGSHLQLVQGQSLGGFELAEPADKVTVSIRDSSGLEVRRLDLGDAEAGSQIFTWDGKTDSGATAADGRYSIKVSATRGDADVKASALELGTVTSIVRGAKELAIEVGQLGSFSMGDIKRILS